MAFTKSDLSDLKQSLADRHDSGVLPTDSTTVAYWIRLLNRGKDYCVDKLQIAPATSSTTTTSGTATLSDAFAFPSAVYTSGNVEVPQIKAEESEGRSDLCYWIAGDWESGFTFNVPTGYDDTYTIYRADKYEDMSADADICPVSDPEAVVAYAYSMLRKAETDPLDDADAAMAECERRIDEMIYQENQRNGGIQMRLENNA